MTVYIGRRGALGATVTPTSGNTAAVKVFLPFLENSLQEMHEPIGDNAARAVRDLNGEQSVEGKKWGEGEVKVVLEPEQAPVLFAGALGRSTITSLGNGRYRHIFTRKPENEITSINFYVDRGTDKIDFPFSGIDELSLEFSEDIASINCSVISQFPVVRPSNVAETPTYLDTENPPLYTFKTAKVQLGTNGAASTTLALRECSVTLNNNLERIYAPNDNDVDRIVSKGFEASGSMRLLLEDETYKNAFKNLTKYSLAIIFNESATTGEIVLYFPRIRIQSYNQNRPIDDLMEQTIDWVAETANYPMYIQVTNEQAKYAP
jgi:hypothetical protein